jgi:ribonuclease-3
MEDPAGSVLDATCTSLQAALHYRFQDPMHLALALAVLVPPLTPEAAAARQRLEFLGDAAWNYAVAAQAFSAWPRGSAGELTRLRASCCSTPALARLARGLGLPSSPGSGERVLAEMLEAVLGAMVEDGGLEPVQALAKRVISEVESDTTPPPVDPKSAFQMLLQAHGEKLPSYRLLERRGPAHHPIFRIRVTATIGPTDIRADGEGSSRQAAEQEAARLALDQLSREPRATSQNPETQYVVGGFPESHQA